MKESHTAKCNTVWKLWAIPWVTMNWTELITVTVTDLCLGKGSKSKRGLALKEKSWGKRTKSVETDFMNLFMKWTSSYLYLFWTNFVWFTTLLISITSFFQTVIMVELSSPLGKNLKFPDNPQFSFPNSPNWAHMNISSCIYKKSTLIRGFQLKALRFCPCSLLLFFHFVVWSFF